MKKIVDFDDLMLLFNIPKSKEAEKIISNVLTFLNYLPVGVSLETSNLRFHKLSHDVMSIESDVKKEEIVDHLEGIKVIRIPV